MDSVKKKKILGSILGVTLLCFAIYVLVDKLQEFTIAEVVEGIKSVQLRQLLFCLLCTIGYYFCCTFYDTLAFRYIGHKLAYYRIALACFVSYAFSTNVGLPILTSSTMRYRIHSAFGVSAADTAKVILFCGFTMWIGFLATAGLVFSILPFPAKESFLLSPAALRILALAALILVLVYAWLTIHTRKGVKIWKLTIPHLTPGILAGQLTVGLLDWIFISLAAYVIMPPMLPIPYYQFLEIFMLAQVAGALSQVPGGIGVFESIFLLFLPEQFPVSEVIGSLLLYRVIFYGLPLVAGTLLLITHEVNLGTKKSPSHISGQ